jgi:hypothetical protein
MRSAVSALDVSNPWSAEKIAQASARVNHAIENSKICTNDAFAIYFTKLHASPEPGSRARGVRRFRKNCVL